MTVPLLSLGAFTQMFTAPVDGIQFSNSQFNSVNPAASEVKIKSQGAAVVLLPTLCVHVLEILPPSVMVAKSAKVPEIKAGKLAWVLGTSLAATVKVAW
jgi:hypothetical protein